MLNASVTLVCLSEIPREIEESAFIDSANVMHILLPMVKPTLVTLAIGSFVGAWNNFLWPLLVLDDSSMYPLTLGLYKLEGTFTSNTRLIATGSVIALAPITFCSSRYKSTLWTANHTPISIVPVNL
ncbi:ABC transporter permease subunit [Numidum massiliense]|uniref:ABC transporter permease subunit n=1 Tax=Numidum massiliense TaxID=1522315 RepID=UPI0006D533EE|nr:ABC transporter permease subunit [Numidum massiliense]